MTEIRACKRFNGEVAFSRQLSKNVGLNTVELSPTKRTFE